jgi:hypothetical protein
MRNIPGGFTNAKPYYKEKGVCALARGRALARAYACVCKIDQLVFNTIKCLLMNDFISIGGRC